MQRACTVGSKYRVVVHPNGKRVALDGMMEGEPTEPLFMTLMISKFRRIGLGAMAVVLMAACAPMTVPPQTEYPAGRARVVLPPGAWQDLGMVDDVAGRVPLQTRSLALRGPQGEWLALLRVQTNRGRELRGSPQGVGYCPRQQDVVVEDAAAASPVRADCLRFKFWGSRPEWLEKNRPDLVQWMGARRIALQQPYAYVSFRYVTEAGIWVAVDALVDQRLVSKKPRTNDEFLVAGLPLQEWARALGQSARQSAGMLDGYLSVPPFPFASGPLPARAGPEK